MPSERDDGSRKLKPTELPNIPLKDDEMWPDFKKFNYPEKPEKFEKIKFPEKESPFWKDGSGFKEIYKEVFEKDKGGKPPLPPEDKELETLRRAIVVQEKSPVTFDQIGGQPHAVAAARLLADQLQHPAHFSEWGVGQVGGILFYGEPGTGKTLIAKALSHHANAAFIMVKATDLASKWYGDAEKLARGVFTIARDEARKHPGKHAILYLDEVDSIIPARSGNVHEATRKVMSEFLQQMDGLNSESGEMVTVIASTNRPEDVDSAFLSRMTDRIPVRLPDEEGLSQIFQIHLAQAEERAGRILVNGVEFDVLGQATVGLSGRDIKDIVGSVLRMKAQQSLTDPNVGLVTTEDIQLAIETSGKVQELRNRQRKSKKMGFNS